MIASNPVVMRILLASGIHLLTGGGTVKEKSNRILIQIALQESAFRVGGLLYKQLLRPTPDKFAFLNKGSRAMKIFSGVKNVASLTARASPIAGGILAGAVAMAGGATVLEKTGVITRRQEEAAQSFAEQAAFVGSLGLIGTSPTTKGEEWQNVVDFPQNFYNEYLSDYDWWSLGDQPIGTGPHYA